MFVGETGIARIVERSAELTKQDKNGDAAALGGIPLDMIQRGINLWFSNAADLFGGEISSNAASYFAAGLKGRAYEMKKYEDHLALDGYVEIDTPKDGRLVTEQVAIRNAMNEILRNEYRDDDQRAVDRWNKVLEQSGLDYRFTLPHRGFNRRVGVFADVHVAPDGRIVDEATWEAKKDDWLLSEKDVGYLTSISAQITEPGKFANWIAPPKHGIKGRPVEFEYVRV